MTELRCLDCGRGYDVNEPVWACACHGVLDLHIKAVFPVKAIRLRRPGLWRYREALPIKRDENIVSFGEGFTPLFPVDCEGSRLFLKLDFLFPTGSFKDRGASVLLSKVKELGIHRVVEDSSGNAGAAIAAYSALAGVQCQVFVPSSTSRTKIRQIELSGAQLVRINGSRADTARAAFETAQHSYYASHYWNPYFFEGTKCLSENLLKADPSPPLD